MLASLKQDIDFLIADTSSLAGLWSQVAALGVQLLLVGDKHY